jgi:GMP synthase (glutamine-hydrolysing)
VCLGAQLLADALGATVTRAEHLEIGWYPVDLTEAGRALPVFADFPLRFSALHWHGDTFSIPAGTLWSASSEACPNQAFVHDNGRVVGLQFHLEETRESLELLVENAREELSPPGDSSTAKWVSTEAELLSPEAPFAPCHELLFHLLDSMVAAGT